MITAEDSSLAERARVLRNHGASASEEQRLLGNLPWMLPDFDVLGYNYRMTDLQAAMGLVQLRKLDGLIDDRHRWAQYYSSELQDLEWLRVPYAPLDYRHGWQAFVCWVDSRRAPMPRNAVMERLQLDGISTRPGTHAVHGLGFYRTRYGTRDEDCPVASECQRHTMAIPLHNRMTEEDYVRVVQALKQLK